MSTTSVPEMIGMLTYFELCNKTMGDSHIELVTITFCSNFTGYLTANLRPNAEPAQAMQRYCHFTSECELRGLLMGERLPVWSQSIVTAN